MSVKTPFPWCGGKTRLLEKLLELMPNKMNTYYEPFLGSGVVFLNVLATKHPTNTVINDINANIISFYRLLKNSKKIPKFENECSKLQNVYNSLPTMEEKKKFFVSVRTTFNKMKKCLRRTAYFYFLTKTFFNGLYNENKKGECNSSVGSRKKIDISAPLLEKINELITDHNVEIHNIYFTDIITKAKKGDFVYLDPPYMKTDTKLFGNLECNTDELKVSTHKDSSGYGKNFTDLDHQNVMRTFESLDRKGVMVMMSNAYNTELMKRMEKFHIYPVKVNRLISGKISTRYTDKFNEVIITNY
jgi:DNA adenine methylase